MKFDYGYRDSTNARLTGVIAAPSRDAAYRLLKEKGVRPIYVTPSKGFWNRILSFGRRGFVIAVLGCLCLLLGGVAVRFFRSARASRAQLEDQASSPLTRRQIYGDPALMERLQLEDYASLFPEPGDRVLAHFAQPAQIDRFVSSLNRDPAARAAAARALAALIPTGTTGAPSVAVLPASRERSELLRIVRWMRGEFAAYLANGLGTPASYLARLLERQQYELQLFNRVQRELEGEKDPAVYEKRNDELRAIGAPTIPLPLPAVDAESFPR